ncbi:C-terminal binding protein [Peptoniphilus equinus]|uniref:C-terminal binding protein n=1 Tax=Peptoniphilus equinus TaxID=3016343 RepID=A0ABY7QW78_9FIRM|nr:C-terminal binding protein [Peptoniphilus equinus]WBW50173.1 C-terminal binding protein [Peptoniphilus equinus]
MLIWIIDEEWSDYDLEHEILEKELPGVEIRHSTYDYEADLKAFGYQADGILAQVYADIPRETIEQLEQCKGIAVYGGGFDRIDIDACKDKGIKVTNIQDYCSEDLADYVIAAIYHGNKHVTDYAESCLDNVKAGKWGALAGAYQTHRIENQKILLVGFGGIGRVVAKRLLPLGIEIMAYDEYTDSASIKAAGVRPVSWEEGFKEADYVSIHLRGVDSNADKIGANEFKLMKNSAYLINTARGKIVKEQDLIDAVTQKDIAGAILDVIKNEPPAENDPILSTDGILVTPHVSYMSYESMRALKEYALGNLLAMLSNKEPRNPVC